MKTKVFTLALATTLFCSQLQSEWITNWWQNFKNYSPYDFDNYIEQYEKELKKPLIQMGHPENPYCITPY